MSTPATFATPWAGDQDPVRAEMWVQYAGMVQTKLTNHRPEPVYSYYLHEGQPVTGLLGTHGLREPVSGMDLGCSGPRGGIVPPHLPEPHGKPVPTDQVSPLCAPLIIEGTGAEPPAEPKG